MMATSERPADSGSGMLPEDPGAGSAPPAAHLTIGHTDTKPGSFDRIRSRDAGSTRRADPEGKQALFSAAEPAPALGFVAVTCPACHQRTVVSLTRLARLALPGVYAPVPGRGHRAWARCPACEHRVWLALDFGR